MGHFQHAPCIYQALSELWRTAGIQYFTFSLPFWLEEVIVVG